MKNKYYIIILIALFIIIIYKCYLVYYYFINNNLPVYDGVMYEKNQILRYFKFENDFSLIQRYSQMIYEFEGNHVSSVFNILIILISPKLLTNDIDIFLSGSISLIILYHSINSFFEKNRKLSLLTFFIVTSIPTIYNYRFGILTYIPDIISGVLLLSSYLYLITFLKSKNYIFIFLSTILVTLAIGFRLNFFVYVTIINIPIIYIIYLKINTDSLNIKKIILLISSILIYILTILYVFKNLNFFLDYYGRDAIYQTVTIQSSVKSILNYLKYEINLLYIVQLITLNLIVNKYYYNKNEDNNRMVNHLLVYPFIILSVLFIIILKATNQPHVFSAYFIFLIPISFVKIKYKKIIPTNKIQISMLVIMNIIISIYLYSIKVNDIKNKETDSDSLRLANQIDYYTEYKKNKKYFILFECALEVPLDVYFFKKYKYLNENNLKFYLTDWDFYGINKSLNFTKIKEYYINNIKITKPELIILNAKKIDFGKGKELATKLNFTLKKYVMNDTNYKKVNHMFYKNQEIAFYKKYN